jgi:hypothetical protein
MPPVHESLLLADDFHVEVVSTVQWQLGLLSKGLLSNPKTTAFRRRSSTVSRTKDFPYHSPIPNLRRVPSAVFEDLGDTKLVPIPIALFFRYERSGTARRGNTYTIIFVYALT